MRPPQVSLVSSGVLSILKTRDGKRRFYRQTSRHDTVCVERRARFQTATPSMYVAHCGIGLCHTPPECHVPDILGVCSDEFVLVGDNRSPLTPPPTELGGTRARRAFRQLSMSSFVNKLVKTTVTVFLGCDCPSFTVPVVVLRFKVFLCAFSLGTRCHCVDGQRVSMVRALFWERGTSDCVFSQSFHWSQVHLLVEPHNNSFKN